MTADRDQALRTVQAWFQPALAPGETLRAAFAATPFRLTTVNSLIAAGKTLVGVNQGRVALLSDQSVHIVGRRFWRRRFRKTYATYSLGTVQIRRNGAAIEINDQTLYLNPAGTQLGHGIGTEQDVAMFTAVR